jgi:hypothetical protein
LSRRGWLAARRSDAPFVSGKVNFVKRVWFELNCLIFACQTKFVVLWLKNK